MSQAAKVFVSHSHHDVEICRKFVSALRTTGADVWYGEHNMGPGQLGPTIERELRDRSLFVVILSPAALASSWVEDETRWAYNLYRKDKSRSILPVLASKVAENDIWLFLQDFKRVEGADLQPYPPDVAVQHILRAFSLNLPGQAPVPVSPQPDESADDLITRGRALRAQEKKTDALNLFQRATVLAPDSFDAWFNLGITLGDLKRFGEALLANERALQLDSKEVDAWNNLGNSLGNLGRDSEGLAAFEQALALNPNEAMAWNNKGTALGSLRRLIAALASYEMALGIDPKIELAWYNKGVTLSELGRRDEALAAI